ncbi:TonB-dependent receptor [Mucilaginibacter sabulilitoris]|uniref:TonB-dependent receptor n=1 Tax=Mucilaginibacter sabulilitoris TaxID=1173583 RepID=A0ABZ0TF09_9SPHI|nr:TonB-dependent receptor [Mucilaginibacter sabulilitoris]WPU91754.1 TonB-dependent receptor [Mucilaginibacter sabulilitoris]
MKFLYTLSIILFTIHVFAQSSKVQGTVTVFGGEAIVNTTVKLLNTNYGDITNSQGKYNINNLTEGNYTISISALGYASQLKAFELKKGQILILDFKLAESNQQLNEVTVSSEKRQEAIQKIPAAITSLDAKQIKDYRLWDITNLTAIAPSLFVVEHGNSTSSNFFNIRGVMGFSNEQAVATYVDGVYQFDYFSAPPLFNDVQSIEILRGPQGTLYGRNAFGGVVNITTKQPGNTPSGYAEMTFGNYGEQRYTVSLSEPIIKDKLFASGSFTYNHRGSIYYNEFTKSGFDRREDYSGNFNLRYLPSAKWSLALNVKTENDNDRGSFPWIGSIDDVFSKPYQVNTNNTNVERRNNFNTSLAANYYGRNFNFTSVSSYIDWHAWYEGKGVDYDFSPLDILSTAPDNHQHVFSQEIRFASPSASQSKFKWVAGAYGFTQNLYTYSPVYYGPDYLQLDPTSGAPFTMTSISHGNNKGYAFFGQGIYSLTDKLDFTAGIRYDYESRGLGQYTHYQKDPDPETLLTPNADYRASFHAVTPKFVLSYKLQENMLLYGSYARGFRAGGLNTNATNPAQVPYQPEHSDNYEIGWKNTLFNNKLKLNLTAFYLEQHNQQISTAMDGINALILNVGEMHNKGAELELTALPIKGLQIDWNGSYSHARYTSLLLYSADAKGVVDYKGDQPINTPPVSSMLAAQYTYNFSGSKQQFAAFVRGEYRYIDKYYFDFINSLSQPAYNLFNAKAGITSKHLELNFWARNISDKKYVAYGSFGTFLLGTPRTYGTTLIAKF